MSEKYLEFIQWLWTEHEKALMEKHKLIMEKAKLETEIHRLETDIALANDSIGYLRSRMEALEELNKCE